MYFPFNRWKWKKNCKFLLLKNTYMGTLLCTEEKTIQGNNEKNIHPCKLKNIFFSNKLFRSTWRGAT